MQLKNGCMAVKLLDFIGLCGEVPVSLVRMLPGYYDYNRRVVTALIREGYLKERRMKGYYRRIVRSLSLTEFGLKQLQRVSPGRAQRVRSHALAPENGHGNWKKTLRRGLPAGGNEARGYLAARESEGVRNGRAARLFQHL